MLTANAINYMHRAAADMLGYEPEGRPYTPDGDKHATAWLIKAPYKRIPLIKRLKYFGYTATFHEDRHWVRVSGLPTNPNAVRILERRQAKAHLKWVRTASPKDLLQLTARF